MAQFNLFIMRPCGGDDQGRGWQIVHRQSGEHILAPSAAAATAWLVGRVEAAPARQPDGPAVAEARRLADGRVRGAPASGRGCAGTSRASAAAR